MPNHPVYVAIPVFNGGKTIREALTSVLKQSYQDFTVLVYDDGSTDRTAQIVSSMAAKDARIQLISGEKNLGRGAARNRLLEAAKGGLIAWQDADDFWHENKLEEQLAHLDTLVGAGLDLNRAIMISTYARRTKRASGINVVKLTPPQEMTVEFVLGPEYASCVFQLQGTIGLADVFLRAGGFDPDLNWSEDLDIALKILGSGHRIVGHPAEKALAVYNHSLRNARGTVVEESHQVLIDRHGDLARKHGKDLGEIFARRDLNYLFKIYLSHQNYPKAMAILMREMSRADNEPERTLQASRNFLALMRSFINDTIAEEAESGESEGEAASEAEPE